MRFGFGPKWIVKIAAQLQSLHHHMMLLTIVLAAGALPWAFIPDATTLHAVDGLASIDPWMNGQHYHRTQIDKFDWTYGGPNGPENWADLKDDYATCDSGHQQSPVDIPPRLKPQPVPSDFSYMNDSPVVVDTGRAVTLQKFSKERAAITFGDDVYDLTSIEFHSPSEHTVGGFNYPMEIQLIHTSVSGKSLGLAVLVEKVPGAESQSASRILSVMQEINSRKSNEIILNPMDLIPKSHRAWVYNGSQTTPPCLENRKWFVFSDTVEFSPDQVTGFRKFYPANVRPVQSLFDRLMAPKSLVFTH